MKELFVVAMHQVQFFLLHNFYQNEQTSWLPLGTAPIEAILTNRLSLDPLLQYFLKLISIHYPILLSAPLQIHAQ
jgi:hypothetical protein